MRAVELAWTLVRGKASPLASAPQQGINAVQQGISTKYVHVTRLIDSKHGSMGAAPGVKSHTRPAPRARTHHAHLAGQPL